MTIYNRNRIFAPGLEVITTRADEGRSCKTRGNSLVDLWRLFCILALIPASGTTGLAATNVAANVSSAAVQAAINASSNGDTVLIPAGAATWTTGVTCTKHLKIFGAGAGKTVITDATGKTGFSVHNITNDLFFRLSGMSFIQQASTTVVEIGNHLAGGGVRYFRLDNLTITNVRTRGMTFAGDLSGVVDHCILTAPGQATLLSVDGDDDGGAPAPYNPRAWRKPFSFGTTNGVVVENCQLNMLTTIANGALDTYAGGIVTMRYNALTNGNIGGHGLDSSGSYRSPLAFEIYCNTNYGSASFSKTYYNFRGGALITYSNWVFAGNPSDSGQTYIALYRTSGTNNTYPNVCCAPWGPISGVNRYDGNTDQYGYPALDQMGYVGPTTFTATNSTQVQMPMYSWKNYMVKQGATTDVSYFSFQLNVTNVGSYAYIPPVTKFYKQNRDFYNFTPMPGYTPLQYPHPLTLIGSGAPNQPPIANAVASPTNGVAPLTVAFSSAGSFDPEGVALTYNWNFGDGSTNTATNPSHTYQIAGVYSARLTVSDGSNTVSSPVITITSLTGSGLTFAADSGVISAPFVAVNGTVSQTLTTGVTNGGRAVYGFTVTNTADYIIAAVVNAPNAAANSFYLNIDSEPTDPTMIWDLPITSDFSTQQVSWRGNGSDGNDQFVPAVFHLASGTHQLILRGSEANTQVRSFSLLPKLIPPQGLRLLGN